MYNQGSCKHYQSRANANTANLPFRSFRVTFECFTLRFTHCLFCLHIFISLFNCQKNTHWRQLPAIKTEIIFQRRNRNIFDVNYATIRYNVTKHSKPPKIGNILSSRLKYTLFEGKLSVCIYTDNWVRVISDLYI